MTAETDISANDECRVMRGLRATPALLDLVATTGGPELNLQTVLRRQFPDELVRAAISLHELRVRAISKFTRADRLWLDRQGLEQATNEQVSQHKSCRFEGRVFDLCCGIGGDTIAMASRCNVIAVDVDPAACLRTEWNAEAYGVQDRLQTHCLDVHDWNETDQLVHIDPDRRPGSSGRVSRIEDYVPGLDYLHALIVRSKGGAIKLSPASNFGGKFPDSEIELISLNGECREATVWFGALAGASKFRATVLPSGESIAGHPMQAAAPVSELRRYIYDPDPAVVRAGLLDLLAERFGLYRLDPAEEYLTSDEVIHSPFLQTFQTLSNLPNNERDLKAWIRTSQLGQLEIKCRHIPIQADALRRRLPLKGSNAAVIFFARLTGKARIIGARRLSTPLDNPA